MAESPKAERRFSDEEVALLIKRAAELQQTEQVAQESSTALTLSEVEQIAREAGIDPLLIRRAAHGLDRPPETSRKGSWAGAPTRIVFERVVDGEMSIDEFEPLVNEIRRTFGDNGLPSIIGRTLAWSSTPLGGRRRSGGRRIDVSVTTRAGVTSIRVEEEMSSLAGALFGGLVAGGAFGTTGMTVGIGMQVLHSAPLTALIWVAVAGGFLTLARTIFGHISSKREKELSALANRLEEQVKAVAVQPAAQVTASAPARTLPPNAGMVAEASG
jgi:hypothetical protein